MWSKNTYKKVNQGVYFKIIEEWKCQLKSTMANKAEHEQMQYFCAANDF